MERFKIDGLNLRNMVINASNNLQEKKEFVNSLNVFPVPDGDTGTNMSMTFKSAVSEVENLKTNSISEVAKQVSRGALMGARGNSGVILSQIFRGIAKGLEEKDEVDAVGFAKSLEEGAKAAYKAVMRPTEGTILTIIRAAGESATSANESDIVKLLEKVCNHTENVLNKTPDMLPALKEAKVVDAGGMGLFIILKGMYNALKNNIEANIEEDINSNAKKTSLKSAQSTINPEDIKYGYCTEFFVNTKDASVKAENLKKILTPVGDSMIVVGVEDIIKVHIHTNDPGWVLSNALKLGELSKIKIDNMREEHRQILELEYATTEDEEEASKESVEDVKEYGFVSVTMGNGLKCIFEDLGVDSVIEGGQTMNPSTQDIIERINKINAKNIFILPNNKNIIMAAEQAAELSDKNVIVIKTKTIPQGITAVTVFDSAETVEHNTKVMNEAIANVSTASVTYAVRDTEIDGKPIKEGNILGLVENKINEVGEDVYDVCDTLISKMVDEDSELITVFYGKDCEEEKVQEFAEKIEEKYDDIDVQFYSGEQPLYYFIVSVE
ncbi:DAK2 domain-containing protein [Clostridium massiliodielmoense]|uniref:DAK2 domain-containing protein n=1 Tax=Clostridium massiliodielmoense TaxID=1776385 RepID=UPI0004D42E6D|nr:DAK2 domain-containing protein [Clostridium massiliodielmoense]KEH97953.1 dihydroxyacetone kinase [Clostridium botulinum C/D str. BKT12695]